MAGGLDGDRGGIRGLLALLDEHQEAIEYDLIALGLRLDWLGTKRLTWRDFVVIVRNSPRTSALARKHLGDDAAWSLTDHLMAGVIDLLTVANWQRGGKKAGPKPKPFPRPGVKDNRQQFGKGAIPIKDFNAWWESKGA